MDLFLNKYKKINAKNINMVPVVLNRDNKMKNNIILKKCKYIIDKQIKIRDFVNIIMKSYDDNKPNESFILFCQNTLINYNLTICDIYDKYKDKDDILNITYSKISSFGF
jgi:hypothetical protein